MLCDYGCGEEAKYPFKNGNWCCSKNFRSCPNMRKKGLPDYKKINKKITCKFCGKLISYTSIKRHEESCYLNPKNLTLCPKCDKPIKNFKKGIACSRKCAALIITPGRTHSDETKEKIRNSVNKLLINEGKLIPKIEKICLYCKKSFLTKNKDQKFCLISHFYKFRKKHPEIYKKKIDKKYKRYKLDCMFNFNVYDFPDEFNIQLINKYGWYKPTNRGNNLNGISRDHIFSISEGFRLGVPYQIISHPTNCNLVRHPENNKKNIKCEISINKLVQNISKWNEKYKIT